MNAAPTQPVGRLLVRPIEPEDADALIAFHDALDQESQYLRFFNVHPHLRPEEVTHFTHVDHRRREALVALDGDRIVAVGRYDELHDDPTTAEVAFVVSLDHRHEGIATWLLRALAHRARAAGFRSLLGTTLSSNSAMRAVFKRSGFPCTSTFGDGVADTRMDIGDA